MDESLHELLSRYLDDDLDDAERVEFERCLEHDTALAAELDAARRLRGAVSAIADRMEPPVTLDPVIKPLRVSAPPPVRPVRPAYRWLGAAAAVVLGVTVVMEVARRNPAPDLGRPTPSRERIDDDAREIFELAPLPTAKPDEDRPLGAADHLLEEEPIEPAAPEPAPLEVMGPLAAGEPLAGADRVVEIRSSQAAEAEETIDTEHVDDLRAVVSDDETGKERAQRTGSLDEKVVEKSVALRPPPKDQALAAAAPATDFGNTGRAKTAPDGSLTMVQARLKIGDREVWAGSGGSCPAGVYHLRIETLEGVIVAIGSIAAGNERDGLRECRPDDLIGSVVAGLEDGDHPAELEIHDGEAP